MSGSVVRFFMPVRFSKILPDGGDTIFWKTDKEAGYDRYCRRMGRDLKNIRQIGTPAEGDRIYIENAAYARVHEETYEERRVFIFMGHTECEQGVYMTL